MKRCFIWIMIVCVWLGSSGFAPGAVQVYSKAMEFAKAGQGYFAFMHYNSLLRNHPASKYREQALFATGEYYFRVSSFQEASMAFKAFLGEYPRSPERLYALVYLLNIAEKEKNAATAEDLAGQIIDLQRVSFIFRETKEMAYRSPLNQYYKAVIHIDKIEFYVEGKLFAQVSY